MACEHAFTTPAISMVGCIIACMSLSLPRRTCSGSRGWAIHGSHTILSVAREAPAGSACGARRRGQAAARGQGSRADRRPCTGSCRSSRVLLEVCTEPMFKHLHFEVLVCNPMACFEQTQLTVDVKLQNVSSGSGGSMCCPAMGHVVRASRA
jgi:hypothetical protein